MRPGLAWAQLATAFLCRESVRKSPADGAAPFTLPWATGRWNWLRSTGRTNSKKASALGDGFFLNWRTNCSASLEAQCAHFRSLRTIITWLIRSIILARLTRINDSSLSNLNSSCFFAIKRGKRERGQRLRFKTGKWHCKCNYFL